MGRGILSGVIWGSVISLMSLWLASQLGGMIDLLAPPENMTLQAPQPAESESDSTRSQPAAPSAEAAAAADPTRQSASLGAAANSQAGDTLPDTQPAAKPQTAAAADLQPGPASEGTPDVTQTSDSRTLPVPELVAPVPSEADAPPATPDAVAPSVAALEPTLPEMPATPSAATAVPEAAPTAEAVVPVPPAPEALPEPADATPDIVVAEAPEALDPPPAPAVEPETEPAPEAVMPAPVATATEAAPQVEPAEETLPTAPDSASEPTILKPGTGSETLPANDGLASLVPSVKVNRLPTIGSATPDATQTIIPETEAATPADGPAMERYAAPFENPDKRPVMAIVLIDEGGPRTDLTALGALPFAVTLAIDASRPDAAAAMADYRAIGREVVAIAPLPAGAQPADVEVALESYVSAVPEAVALMDMPDGAFQSSRQVATQVALILKDRGQGMITYNRGLNAATQVAEREGVAAQLVFRDFDSDGQNMAAIKRFLDQAAFRAGQQSGVVLVGHIRPETIAALVEWGLGIRAATVALAPVSVVLAPK